MLEIMYILFLLVVINFYLNISRRNTYKTVEKFMISLMSIFILFLLFQFIAYLSIDTIKKMMTDPLFNIIFMVTMSIILPILSTELILLFYIRFKKK
jgi:hypothetical protein